jgi:hydrogenase maturation protease
VNRELAKQVADAVLYEGYVLYPYRPSALKNQQRWSFGILYPPAYDEVRRGTERAIMHTECLLELKHAASVQIQCRFLHLLRRQVMQEAGEKQRLMPSLVIDGGPFESFDEAVEHSVEAEQALSEASQQRIAFSFPEACEAESLRSAAGEVMGSVTRTQHEIRGAMTVSCESIREGLLKLTIRISNETELAGDTADRNSALFRSLLSAHMILSADGAEFVSLLDPPEAVRALAAGCKNEGNFPVLVGEAGERHMLLCSPIILYDYPQIAPESAGDFYDATEIDEMLTLRLMTLADPEKDEICRADTRARDLLQRTQENARQQLMRTHGTIRNLRAVNERS